MHQKQSELRGTIQVLQELSRSQAASQLEPPVTTRTLQKYLELAALFLPTFEEFLALETGYLNRFAKINSWHLPKLQRVREYARNHGMTQLQVALSQDIQYFETGVSSYGNNQTGSRSTPCPDEKTA